MNMIDLDTFLPDILPFAPDCPEPTAYMGIRRAAIEFCERTKLWRFNDTFNVTAEDCQQIMAPSDSTILQIEELKFNGDRLKPKTTAWLDEHYPNWRGPIDTDDTTNTDASGAPIVEIATDAAFYTQTDLDSFTLYPMSAGTVYVAYVLKPTNDCDTLPDFLYDKWAETIAAGALKRILMIPNQPFSDPQRAGAFSQQFAARLDSLSTLATRGQQKAPTRTKGRFF